MSQRLVTKTDTKIIRNGLRPFLIESLTFFLDIFPGHFVNVSGKMSQKVKNSFLIESLTQSLPLSWTFVQKNVQDRLWRFEKSLDICKCPGSKNKNLGHFINIDTGFDTCKGANHTVKFLIIL